jgi:hypothetical protein
MEGLHKWFWINNLRDNLIHAEPLRSVIILCISHIVVSPLGLLAAWGGRLAKGPTMWWALRSQESSNTGLATRRPSENTLGLLSLILGRKYDLLLFVSVDKGMFPYKIGLIMQTLMFLGTVKDR